MSTFLKRIMADQSGASTAEYAILVSAIAVAAAAAVALFGTGLNAMFTNLNTKLENMIS